jgi:hypothetical protein
VGNGNIDVGSTSSTRKTGVLIVEQMGQWPSEAGNPKQMQQGQSNQAKCSKAAPATTAMSRRSSWCTPWAAATPSARILDPPGATAPLADLGVRPTH